MIADNGMSGVTVKKVELLDALTRNRDTHRDTFIDAQKGYRDDVIKELEQHLDDARKGKNIRRSISLVEPKDHTKDYDRVIRMLQMSVNEEVFISEQEFQQYVQDDWGWKHDFEASTMSYVNRSR